jgi:CBS domain-containing protein
MLIVGQRRPEQQGLYRNFKCGVFAPAKSRGKAKMTVQRILYSKGTAVPTISPDATIVDVIARLEAEDSGALVVSSDGKAIEGIISERDVVRGLRQFGTNAMAKKVTELMTKKVLTCNANDRVAGVMAMMDAQKIRHVPVVQDGNLAGMVSMRDIIKLRLDEVQAEADAMRTYIGHG